MSKADKPETKTRKRRPLAVAYKSEQEGPLELIEPPNPITSPTKLREWWLFYCEGREEAMSGTARMVSLLDPLPKVVRREVVEFEK